MGFDIIGDVHGYADELKALLNKLGYRVLGGVWQHPDRTAVFLGDLVDRGPKQLETIDIVRRMSETDHALVIMGNHEFNAIAWFLKDPEHPGEYLRSHNSEKNHQQHEEFLNQVGTETRHREIIDWFLTLPLWLDLQDFRAVHACWHQPFMDFLTPKLSSKRQISRDLMISASLKPLDPAFIDNAEPSVYKAVDVILKGLECPLPEGITFADKGGHTRDRTRIRWWDKTAADYRSASLGLSAEILQSIPADPLPGHVILDLGVSEPVFFGHYWFTGTPIIQANNATCLDYSIALGGNLAAYQWDGEETLNNDKLVWV